MKVYRVRGTDGKVRAMGLVLKSEAQGIGYNKYYSPYVSIVDGETIEEEEFAYDVSRLFEMLREAVSEADGLADAVEVGSLNSPLLSEAREILGREIKPGKRTDSGGGALYPARDGTGGPAGDDADLPLSGGER